MMEKHTVITEDTPVATSIAQRVMQQARGQGDVGILYYYAVAMCEILKPEGRWVSPDPAPLTVEQIKVAFNRVKKHPEYQHQTLITHTREGVQVGLIDGHVTTNIKQGWNLTPLGEEHAE